MLENLEDMFPSLYGSGFQIASPVSLEYNCVAWALGITTEWWSHDRTWPDSVPRSPSIHALTQVFELFGYVICDSAEREPGYDKVALYALDSVWQHAARQLHDGRWTSKLGPFEDISHQSPDDLAGVIFGEVNCIMRRPLRR